MIKGKGEREYPCDVTASREQYKRTVPWRERPSSPQDLPLPGGTQPRPKHVTFATVETWIPPTTDVHSWTWYHESELVAFRTSAQILADQVKLRELDRIIVAKTGGGDAVPLWKIESLKHFRDRLAAHIAWEGRMGRCKDKFDAVLVEEGMSVCPPRGLEFRSSFERPKGRRLAIRAVLRAQAQLRRCNEGAREGRLDESLLLSIVASKATRNARDLALQTARADFEEAHGRDAASPVVVSSAMPPRQSKRQKRHEIIREKQRRRFLCPREVAGGDTLITSPA